MLTRRFVHAHVVIHCRRSPLYQQPQGRWVKYKYAHRRCAHTCFHISHTRNIIAHVSLFFLLLLFFCSHFFLLFCFLFSLFFFSFLCCGVSLFRKLVDVLKFYQGFEINDHTGEALSDNDMLSLHYGKMSALQLVAYTEFAEQLRKY